MFRKKSTAEAEAELVYEPQYFEPYVEKVHDFYNNLKKRLSSQPEVKFDSGEVLISPYTVEYEVKRKFRENLIPMDALRIIRGENWIGFVPHGIAYVRAKGSLSVYSGKEIPILAYDKSLWLIKDGRKLRWAIKEVVNDDWLPQFKILSEELLDTILEQSGVVKRET
jgi:hypothetical protein